MTELKSEGVGVVRIADEVLAVIAGTAALEADGIAGLAGYAINRPDHKSVRKHMAKGVNVAVSGNHVTIGVAITVRLGKKLQEVSRDVQQKVKNAIETMTGLIVAEVNVAVGALANDKQRV